MSCTTFPSSCISCSYFQFWCLGILSFFAPCLLCPLSFRHFLSFCVSYFLYPALVWALCSVLSFFLCFVCVFHFLCFFGCSYFTRCNAPGTCPRFLSRPVLDLGFVCFVFRPVFFPPFSFTFTPSFALFSPPPSWTFSQRVFLFISSLSTLFCEHD